MALEKLEMNALEYQKFLEVLMCADPWPYGQEAEEILKDFANMEALNHGYDNWIEAYHGIDDSANEVRLSSSQFGAGA